MSGSTDECIFCRIVRGEMGTEFLAESGQAVAFRDLHPQAPTHILVVTKRHYGDITEIAGEDPIVAASLINLAVAVARKEGVEDGFRLLTNTGENAGQSVHHLHFHVIGGTKLSEGLV